MKLFGSADIPVRRLNPRRLSSPEGALLQARRRLFGGSPRIHAGEGALQRSGKSPTLIMRFSAGNRKPRAKAHFQNRILFRRTEVQLPLLKQGAPTRSLLIIFHQPRVLYRDLLSMKRGPHEIYELN